MNLKGKMLKVIEIRIRVQGIGGGKLSSVFNSHNTREVLR